MEILFYSDRDLEKGQEPIELKLSALSFVDTNEGLKIKATIGPNQDYEGDFVATLSTITYHVRPTKKEI